ncbi:membrane cofactor protein-like isoform X1 [Lagopus leucura]|uniref:membrane cofactor protein-like isoform X1 n=2 Tax=Lagopus leucura TaxID=30410 RepID=UPI001C680C31|nr:membrane cofactor protein-like isoform X1 [Lagopus leucura]
MAASVSQSGGMRSAHAQRSARRRPREGRGAAGMAAGALGIAVLLAGLCAARAQESCTLPDNVQYAELMEDFSTMSSFPVGTSVSYTCRPGYMRIPGMPVDRTCGKNLMWSQIETFCTAKRCIHPGELEHGFVNVTDLTFGSAATFSCEKGYRLYGNSQISCVIKDKGVDWNGGLPVCDKVPCAPPPSIANGHYTEADNYVYQTAVTYSCNDVQKGEDPFSLVGSPSIFCTVDENSNGVWSGPPPQCKVVICENPDVENGRKLSGFASHYTYGSTVMFECDPDYVLFGNDVITCQENSTWYPSIPTCKKVSEDSCGAPKISHGEVVPPKSVYLRGESVQIRCIPHCAFPDGGTEVTVTCQGQNTWSSEPNCACGPEPSDSSPVISHGRIIEGKKSVYSIGDSVTIECYAGYTLHGAARIEYIGEGRWSPEVPICKLSAYIIAIICVIVAVVVFLAAFWIFKKFISQEGSYTVDESCKKTCILKTNTPAEMEELHK